MRVFSTDHLEVPLPAGHRFPMSKYRRLRERLVEAGVLRASELVRAPAAPLDRIGAVHDPAYVRAFIAGNLSREAVRRIGFPWSPALVDRTLGSVGGTLAAARVALDEGFAGNLAGGTHHAHRDFGSGYCVFNDLAVTARTLLDERAVERVAVVDLDVHQGDGTATLCAGDERVFTLSVHGARNFPSRKQTSDLDLGLADGTGDQEYLELVEAALDRVFDGARPQLVLYQAGVDPLAEDRLGRLALTLDGLAARDALVFERCRAEGAAVVATLGGGYADPLEPTLAAHEGTYRAARSVFDRG
ncbi:histone deacetylase [Engelhardtia mirabilis]|uniref:Acetoin utilization protein AcuC n=1 Tax=Engelhardtia mirabilis TaxID=2528011 RepID=A0A518BLM4_9BACT|nr:Acetoin utilization protein AcuC [Planctomycetes bacterium Pla133]QDV02201.1 Acetoin utilization protein AcuC [Planctomycetes bacterium Pla86]